MHTMPTRIVAVMTRSSIGWVSGPVAALGGKAPVPVVADRLALVVRDDGLDPREQEGHQPVGEDDPEQRNAEAAERWRRTALELGTDPDPQIGNSGAEEDHRENRRAASDDGPGCVARLLAMAYCAYFSMSAASSSAEP